MSVDTTRADYLGCYGSTKAKTPNIDRFASEGARFEWCISSAPLTFPSHSTMMTGSYPYVHGARDNGIYVLSDANETLAELFKQAGYSTHAEVAAVVLSKRFNLSQGFDTYGEPDNLRPDSPPGFEWQDEPEEQFLEDALSSPIDQELERKGDEITRYGIDLLQKSKKSGKPFFIWLHYFDPHWPHEPLMRFAEQYPRDLYHAEIASFDAHFGKLIDALRDLGLAETTLVVLISDHGEGRGNHGEYTHSSFLYDTTLHVPLIIWAPGRIPSDRVIESQVRSIDAASTIVDFVGLPRTQQMQGVSLLPLIENPDLKVNLPGYSDTMVPLNMHKYSQLRSLRTNEWKFILAPKPELYRISEDRLELFNLAGQEADVTLQLRDDLRELIASSPSSPGGRATRQEADESTMDELRALGYLSDVASADKDPLTVGSELDHFEPVGKNPKDHMEVIDCYATAMGSIRAGKYENAKGYLKRLVELDPTSAVGWSMLGSIYFATDRLQDAIDANKKALALDETDALTHRRLGLAYLQLGDLDAAKKAAVDALKHAPSDWEGYWLMGRVHFLRGEFKQALDVLATADKESPNNADIKVSQGTLRLLGRQPRKAIELLEEAVRISPKNSGGHFHLGRAYAAIREYEKTVECIEQALSLSEDITPAYAVGAAAYHELGDNRMMIDMLRRGHGQAPDDRVISNDLAWWLATVPEDELRDGEAATRIALKAAGDAGMEHFNELDTLAAAYAEVGQFEKAVTTARRAAKLAAEAGLNEAKQDIDARISLYEQNKPYRSE